MEKLQPSIRFNVNTTPLIPTVIQVLFEGKLLGHASVPFSHEELKALETARDFQESLKPSLALDSGLIRQLLRNRPLPDGFGLQNKSNVFNNIRTTAIKIDEILKSPRDLSEEEIQRLREFRNGLESFIPAPLIKNGN